MNMDEAFSEAVVKILEHDTQYARSAYYFVRAGLDHTVKKIATGDRKRAAEKGEVSHHVSGQELLEGLRELALDQYGPMAYTLLSRWGLHNSSDFGAIVFNLVEAQVLGKTEKDSANDFRGVYDFKDAFLTPFKSKLRLRVKQEASTEKAATSSPPVL
ncbi:MAG: hypothetical protein LBV54_00270 [Puniceicoccales bacterium]|jgi:uncharacterized repeat protein (TIGR04138 family)|nr:hypothetical protein [Puniceicoccales bacterium]